MAIRGLPMAIRRWLTSILGSATLAFLAAFALQSGPSQPGPEQRLSNRTDIYKTDFGELARYREQNAHLSPPAPGENRVVFFGDSITDWWSLPEYFPGKPYVNRGIKGQTTSQMLVRFQQDVIALQPKVVVILAGTNDIAGNTGPMRIEDIESDFASLAELAAANKIKVIFSSILPIHNYTPQSQDSFAQRSPDKILYLNRWLSANCAARGWLYLDYFGAMVDAHGLLQKDLAEDGLHPNKEGYKIMARLAESAIQKALHERVQAK